MVDSRDSALFWDEKAGSMVQIVTIINFKGGVGKTLVRLSGYRAGAASWAADAARRSRSPGKRDLLCAGAGTLDAVEEDARHHL